MTMRKQPVTRRQFLGSGIAAVGVMSVGALPANAREWEEYAERFDRSISDSLPTGPLRPDDETAWKAVAKNYSVTNKITNLENGYWESWPIRCSLNTSGSRSSSIRRIRPLPDPGGPKRIAVLKTGWRAF